MKLLQKTGRLRKTTIYTGKPDNSAASKLFEKISAI
jgi:hypothetical protein